MTDKVKTGRLLIIPMDEPCIFVEHLGFAGSTWHKSSEIVSVVEAIGLLKQRNEELRRKNDRLHAKNQQLREQCKQFKRAYNRMLDAFDAWRST